MNIYLAGITATMIFYIIISSIISRKVRDANDFYVSGRNAPAFLITGSLVASFLSPEAFMGDVGEAYNGFFAPVLIVVCILSVGYIMGSVFFGRFLRRSEVITIPQYFGKRFDSQAVKTLATVTSIFTMTVYSLSCIQGVASMMSLISGLEYNTCIIISVSVFTIITAFAGAKGVLITDTIMFGIFSAAAIIGVAFISHKAGGWVNAVKEMASYKNIPGILSWSGNLDYFYHTGRENIIWALGYGVAWMAVLMVAPWQSSRYIMAKNEHAVIRSSIFASFSVFVIEFLMCMAGVFTQKLNPGMKVPSHALIWASMNIMPSILGIIVLSGILAAGISSATTFLSLISSNIVNDILNVKDGQKSILYGRLSIIVLGIIICVLCICQPPQIFWIVYLGATIIACSWLPAAIASVWSKRVTKAGVFWGMLTGFIVSSVMKIGAALANVLLPIYFDSFFVGMLTSIIVMVIVSSFTQVTDKEKEKREKLFIMPEKEKNAAEIKKTKLMIALSIPLGFVITGIMLFLWAIPYLEGLH